MQQLTELLQHFLTCFLELFKNVFFWWKKKITFKSIKQTAVCCKTEPKETVGALLTCSEVAVSTRLPSSVGICDMVQPQWPVQWLLSRNSRCRLWSHSRGPADEKQNQVNSSLPLITELLWGITERKHKERATKQASYLLHDLGRHPAWRPHKCLPNLVPCHVSSCC